MGSRMHLIPCNEAQGQPAVQWRLTGMAGRQMQVYILRHTKVTLYTHLMTSINIYVCAVCISQRLFVTYAKRCIHVCLGERVLYH